MTQITAHEVIVKTVLGCNLACTYCYVDHGRGMRTARATPISLSILETFIPQFMAQVPRRGLIDWHGGEPLLAGLDFFKEVWEIEVASIPDGKILQNNIQTNATLVDEDWASFFKEHNFRVGLSIDGHPEVHDRFRVNHAGRPSSLQVIEGIRLLQEAEVPFGVIVVVSPVSVGLEEELFHFLIDNNIHIFDLAPCMMFDHGTGQPLFPTISPADYGKFLVRMYDVWMNHGDPRVKIRRFDSVHSWMMGRTHHFCQFAGKCTGYITLDYNGDISPCDELIGFHRLVFGNITNQNLGSILNSPQCISVMSEINAQHNLHADCKACDWLYVCKGGCPATKYKRTQDFTGKEYTCESRLMLFEHIASKLKRYQDRDWVEHFQQSETPLRSLQAS